jgi:hypothetical protein
MYVYTARHDVSRGLLNCAGSSQRTDRHGLASVVDSSDGLSGSVTDIVAAHLNVRSLWMLFTHSSHGLCAISLTANKICSFIFFLCRANFVSYCVLTTFHTAYLQFNYCSMCCNCVRRVLQMVVILEVLRGMHENYVLYMPHRHDAVRTPSRCHNML